MDTPKTPNNEAQRLAALTMLNILDTPAEERFDRLTRLARKLLNVPVALVSLVDKDRQWFKSAAGLDASETPRDISFCGHAILQDKLFVVSDASQDKRFADNPLVTDEPRIRFYAGFPLTAATGEHLGTFCIIDRKPRQLSEDDRQTLEDLAHIAERELSASYLASTDADTGLCNRTGFELLAQKLMNACSRVELPASAAFFRLLSPMSPDSGKLCPEAASAFSEILTEACGEGDLNARTDDTHFACLLNSCPGNQVADFLQRVEHGVERHNQRHTEAPIVLQSSWLAYNPFAHHSITALMQQGAQRLDIA